MSSLPEKNLQRRTQGRRGRSTSSIQKFNPTHQAIHNFLVQFHLSQYFELTRDEARGKARKIKVDGKALYELPEKGWINEFGNEGETIDHAL